MSFFAKEREIERALSKNQSMIVFLYNEACFLINELNVSLLSVVVTLLQDYDDVFLEELPNGLLPIRGMNIKLILYQAQQS